jgi:hypothetical protein
MKRSIILVLVCATLFACSKKSTPLPYKTVEYRFVGAPSNPYSGIYVNEKGAMVDTGFFGTTFSKTIRVTKASGFRYAELSFDVNNAADSGNGTVTILVDGNVVLQQNVYFANPALGFDCKTQVFGDD